MSRLHIPGVVDLLRVDDPDLIAALADDERLDRDFKVKGPLLNRLVIGNLRKALVLGGAPLPSVAPRGASRPTAAQAALEGRLDRLAAAWPEGDTSLRRIGAFVRGGPGSAGILAQEAVGRLFDPQYTANPASWSAAVVLDKAARSLNPLQRLWWILTGAVGRSRRLLAGKVKQDPSGLHGTGVAVHNIVTGLETMRALWADPVGRRATSPEAAAAKCLVAPAQVLRQPVSAGLSLAGGFETTTLVMLQLGPANAKSPGVRTAFMSGSWSQCPAHAWTRTLLEGAWRTAQELDHG